MEHFSRGRLSVKDDSLGKEFPEEGNIKLHPVAQLLWLREVADGDLKEDIHDCEADLVNSAGKGALGVNGNHCQRFEGSRKDEGSYRLL